MKPCEDCKRETCIDCEKSTCNNKKKEGVVSGHFSANNSILYHELIECVKKIEESNCSDTTIKISREYYHERIKE